MEELENIFDPLKNIQQAAPKPYLATRVKAALQKQTAESPIERLFGWMVKPAVLAIIFALVIGAHYTIWQQDSTSINEVTEEVVDNDLDFNMPFTNFNIHDDEK